MDDQQTRDTLDALADLYLTDEAESRAHPDSETDDTSPDEPADNQPSKDESTAKPTRRATAAHDLDGPAPIRLRPTPAKLNLTPRLTPGSPGTPGNSPDQSIERDAGAASGSNDSPEDALPPDAASAQPGDNADESDPSEDDAHAPYPFMPGQPRSVADAEAQKAREQHRPDAATRPQRDTPDAATTEPVPDGEAERSSGAVHRAGPLYVEAVLLGNLPGFGGPWLTQYAQLLAQESGPVVVLHVDPGQIDIELIEPRDRATPSVLEGIDTHQPDATVHALLHALLERTAPGDSSEPAIGTLLLHVAEAGDGRQLWRRGSVTDWTLLTGSDDAAIVAGYRAIKDLVDGNAPESRPATPPRVGLMVMGSEQPRAHEAARKVQKAANDFLTLPIQLVGFQKRMEPVNLSFLGSFERQAGDWDKLHRLLERYPRETAELVEPDADAESEAQPVEAMSVRLPDEAAAEEPAAVAAPPREEPSQSADGPGREPERQPGTERGRFGFGTQRPAARDDQRAARTITGEPEPEPQARPQADTASEPEPAPQPARPAAPTQPEPVAESDAPDLTQFVTMGNPDDTLDGAVALEARCPDYPRVQLLLSQDGRLHLLARHHTGAGPQADARDLRDAVLDLLDAQRWTVRHAQLIQLTQRQLRMDTALEPVLHLFVDDARRAGQINRKLGQTLTLHLLEQITVGDQQAWYSTRLS